MGLSELIGNALRGKGGGERKGQAQPCPNCGETLNLSMERCPKCGVRVKSMFRRKCPKCGALNEIDAKRCESCGYEYEAELERAKKTFYVCPICNFKMDSVLTACPSCGTRFM